MSELRMNVITIFYKIYNYIADEIEENIILSYTGFNFK